MMFDLEKKEYKTYVQYLNDFAPYFKKYLIDYLQSARTQFESDKNKYVDKYLYNLLFEYTENSGKMHRPLTCIAAYLAVGGNYKNLESVFSVASAIEHFQTAALIHDDIADCGEIRRGKPCMHKVYGEGLSINAGDFGLAMTIGCVWENLLKTNYSQDKISKIINKLIFMEYMTIEGQAMDLGWAHDDLYDVSVDDYIVMATKKSAYYSAAIPCVLGAICADANDEIINAFELFGEKIGLAFQIQDDILNLVDGRLANKDFRSDITEGKRTIIVCNALSRCQKNDKDALIKILKSNTRDNKKLDEAVCIMKDCGAIDKSKKLACDLAGDAKNIIKDKLKESMWKDIIIDMANWAVERGY